MSLKDQINVIYQTLDESPLHVVVDGEDMFPHLIIILQILAERSKLATEDLTKLLNHQSWNVDFEQIAEHLKKREDGQKDKVIAHLAAQAAVASVISELQADPRWLVYGNHLETIRQEYERQAKGYEQGLVGAEFMEPKRYGQVKMSLAEAKGVSKGIKLALDLAKELIERGEIAAEALAELAKKSPWQQMLNHVIEKNNAFLDKKPDIEAIRREVGKIKVAYGGRCHIEDWDREEGGCLRVLMTWKWEAVSS